MGLINVPFHDPVEIVPNEAMFVEPAQVLNAVFSTFPRPTSPFTIPVGELITGEVKVLLVRVCVSVSSTRALEVEPSR